MSTSSQNKSNRIGLSTMFFLHGVICGLWFTQIPYIQEKLNLTNTQLSMALLSMALGSFPGLALSTKLVPSFGSKKCIVVIISIFLCVLPIILFSPSYPFLIIAVGVFGFVIGAGDVALNSRASLIESQYGHSIMSSFHAFWSISGLIAAGIAKLAFSFGWSVNVFVPLVCGALFILAVHGFIRMKSYGKSVEIPAKPSEKGPLIVFPKGSLIVVSVIVVFAFISEGAVYDWGTLYLSKVRKLDLGTAALGFGGFSFLMAVGRMFGDRITRKIGHAKNVAISSFFAAVTMSIAVLSPNSYVSLICIALTGIGMANIVPVLFSIAGNSPDMDSVAGIASVSMVGYGAFMIGPPFMGMVADRFSLSVTMGAILVFSVGIAIVSAFFLKTSAISSRESVCDLADGHEPIERILKVL